MDTYSTKSSICCIWTSRSIKALNRDRSTFDEIHPNPLKTLPPRICVTVNNKRQRSPHPSPVRFLIAQKITDALLGLTVEAGQYDVDGILRMVPPPAQQSSYGDICGLNLGEVIHPTGETQFCSCASYGHRLLD